LETADETVTCELGVLSDLTLGQVWDVNLQRNEAIVKDVILVAQGEMALEEFLKQVTYYLNLLKILFFRTYNITCSNM
jgi:hypothetical protein